MLNVRFVPKLMSMIVGYFAKQITLAENNFHIQHEQGLGNPTMSRLSVCQCNYGSFHWGIPLLILHSQLSFQAIIPQNRRDLSVRARIKSARAQTGTIGRRPSRFDTV